MNLGQTYRHKTIVPVSDWASRTFLLKNCVLMSKLLNLQSQTPFPIAFNLNHRVFRPKLSFESWLAHIVFILGPLVAIAPLHELQLLLFYLISFKKQDFVLMFLENFKFLQLDPHLIYCSFQCFNFVLTLLVVLCYRSGLVCRMPLLS